MALNPGYIALVTDAKTRILEIDIAGYQALAASGKPFVLVDVREDNEWAAGHAAGAMHLGKGIIERDVETAIPDKSAKIVMYCGGGYRSALAADMLRQMGYKDPISLDGGWKAWVAAGLPTER